MTSELFPGATGSMRAVYRGKSIGVSMKTLSQTTEGHSFGKEGLVKLLSAAEEPRELDKQ